MGILAALLINKQLNDSQFEVISSMVRDRVLSVCTPISIYIFGSYARGSISEASDLDVAVIFEKSDLVKVQKKCILNSKLFLDYSVDFLFYSIEEFEKKADLGGICSIIKNEGKLIYDKRTEV